MTAGLSSSVYKPALPSMTFEQASLACLLFRRRMPWNVCGFQITAVPVTAGVKAPFAVNLTFDSAPAVLQAPWALVQHVLATLEPTAMAATGKAALLLAELAMESHLLDLDLALPGWTSNLAESVALKGYRTIIFRCQKGAEIHDVLLDLSEGAQHALARALAARPTLSSPLIPVSLTVSCRIGSVKLSVGELRALRQGDVLLPGAGSLTEEMVAVASETLCWRGKIEQNRVTLLSLCQTAGRGGMEDWTMQGPVKRDPTAPIVDATLEELPIRVVFEVGRLDISLGELSAMLPGYVISLGRDAASPVDILANGRRIGQGEVVSVGDTLGVRILTMGP